MGPSRAVPSGAAVPMIIERLPEPPSGRPILVCIEGPGGAGKSMLAAALTETLAMTRREVHLVHGDDFYGPEERDWRGWSARQGYERYFDHHRLEEQLLHPLRTGAVARFQRYDWATNKLAEWVEVPPTGFAVVEGVYLLRIRLRQYWDLAVYVATPRPLRQARLYARGENDPGWIARWSAAEDYYERVERPAAAADLVVDGS